MSILLPITETSQISRVFADVRQARRIHHDAYTGRESRGLVTPDAAKEWFAENNCKLFKTDDKEYVFVTFRADGYDRFEIMTRYDHSYDQHRKEAT